VSLNTVADHILRVHDYAEALKNGQIPRANAIANTIAKNLGKPEITNFEAGRDIMADEVVRLLTTTGGTEADRKGMQDRISSMQSPEQFAGVFGALKDFTGARFEALRQQYAQGDPQREKDFMERMLTPKGRQVFEKVSGQSTGADVGAPVPTTGGTARPGTASGGGPPVGTVDGGYRFKGGDPKDQSNWEPVH
jgi:hypothetical protein